MKTTLGGVRVLIGRVIREAVVKKKVVRAGATLTGSSLAKGMLVEASYNSSNQGTDVVEILGVSDNKSQYGDGGVKYDSVKEAMRAAGVKSLKAMEELDSQNEYGFSHRLWVKVLAHEGGAKFLRGNRKYEVQWNSPAEQADNTGPYYYLYEGRWARGSGAEKLSFRTLSVDTMKGQMKSDEYRRPTKMLMDEFAHQNPSGDVLDFAWWLLREYGAEMPKFVRAEVEKVTGFGGIVPIQSVDDAMEVAKALRNPEGQNGVRIADADGWRTENVDFDALGEELVSAAQGLFGQKGS